MRRLLALLTLTLVAQAPDALTALERPNILLCISDDQSYAHTSANGDKVVRTPAFDQVAREGLRFTHAFCDAPSCGPSRSALLTGQAIWRLEEAGNIHSTLPVKFPVYTELLEQAGYFVGFTGKGWGPGRLEPGGRTRNPAGQEFSGHQLDRVQPKIANKDYAADFREFLQQRPADKPFCFWLGTYEPHRAYQAGAGSASGKSKAHVKVPGFLPDQDVVREDILDYYTEVEHFDAMVAQALSLIAEADEIENTIVVITSDHGMPFPRAKASLYDAGSRVPLAIRWPAGVQHPGRVCSQFVNLSDLAPTFLEAAGISIPPVMTGRSLMPLLRDEEGSQSGWRDHALVAMERHDGCRKGGLGYPCRAMRTADFLYIRNYEPGRWPAGNPDASVCARAIPFGEVDSSPTKKLLMDHADDPLVKPFFDLAFSKRAAEELYDLKSDPAQIRNVALEAGYESQLQEMRDRLHKRLVETADPRATGGQALWDHYPYYGLRRNKDWQVASPPDD